GSLGVGAGMSIVPAINQIRADKTCLFDLVVRSQDYHPAAHASAAATRTRRIWPTDHCLQTGDSGFVSQLFTEPTDLVVQKGGNPNIDAYSAFKDNARIHSTPLDADLKAAGIDKLYITGIATDFCVFWTATDGALLGYDVTVVLDA
ncbi:Isochorismatase-like protein, partial [Pelagophyceae sp. CCMP2097]